MYVAILGRQASLSMAELESRFGSENTRWFSSFAATVDIDHLEIETLGGTQKAGKVVLDLTRADWQKISHEVIANYSRKWADSEGKITLGISAYGFDISPREVQRIGIVIKKNLKKDGVSLRLIPNAESSLNTATSHHNKLGLSSNKVELLIIKSESGAVIVAESTGAQNITALARRDQGRPKRDAFVGMLPPKLAQIMINFAHKGLSKNESESLRLLDAFCGTGVILQEAALLGYSIYGTDLSEKMIRYSRDNINWLQQSHHISTGWYLHEGDAMTTSWQQPIDLVVSETYLGQPFSAPPSPKKLDEVRKNVNHITTSFLKNIHSQLTPGTPLCLAVPAWRDGDGKLTHLPFIQSIEKLGYSRVDFKHVSNHELVYFREDQVVARELLVLVRA